VIFLNKKNKSKIYILDTSIILSGKPISLDDGSLVTTPGVSNEITPGGKDYHNFQYLLELGLLIHSPSKKSIDKILETSSLTGDKGRLSETDTELLALAYELKKTDDKEPVILTDDYSIQNIANHLEIKYQSINQKGITKRFKWTSRCRGCGKKFKEDISICPICGSEIKKTVSKQEKLG